MAMLEAAIIDPSWDLGCELPHACEWHPLTKEKSDQIRSTGEGQTVFLHHGCVRHGLKKYKMVTPVGLEYYRLAQVRGSYVEMSPRLNLHTLVRPCGHMVVIVNVQSNIITAASLGGNILVTETFIDAEQVLVSEFTEICKKKLHGLNKLSRGSTLSLVLSPQMASSSIGQPNRPLRGTAVLKAEVNHPKRWVRLDHLKVKAPQTMVRLGHLKVTAPQTMLDRFFKRKPRQ
jgi:hypothetical protein